MQNVRIRSFNTQGLFIKCYCELHALTISNEKFRRLLKNSVGLGHLKEAQQNVFKAAVNSNLFKHEQSEMLELVIEILV